MPRGRIGLVGANGAGKTTFFRLLLGLSRPTEGTVEVCGRSVADNPIGARERLGYMPEHECLPLDQSASDVVSMFGELSGLPPREARKRASEVLDLVGLDEARFRAVGGFSTGMRQRVKLAQALVADPELALLDEPTSGLDPTGREEMLALVHRLGSFGISVLLATHLLDDVAKVCDHVIMLDAGRLIVSGSTQELLAPTGTVTIEVGRRAEGGDEVSAGRELAEALTRLGLTATLSETGVVEVTVARDEELDQIRDAVVDLGLPLHKLATRVGSLDDAFVRAEATRDDTVRPAR